LRYEKKTLNLPFLDSEWLFHLVPNKYLHRSILYVSNDLEVITEKSKRLKVKLVFGCNNKLINIPTLLLYYV